MQGGMSLSRILLLFSACGLLWLGMGLAASRHIVGAMLPLLQREISWIAPQFTLTDLRLTHTGLEESIQVLVNTKRFRVIRGGYLPAGIPLQSSTLAGNVLQPLILMLSLVSGAGLIYRRQFARMILISIPAAFALVMLDVPFVLVGALEDLVLSSANSLSPNASLWILWMNFLNGGGRWALGIAAALTVIALALNAPPLTAMLSMIKTNGRVTQ